MNTIGIDRNLDRPRIRKLLAIGLVASCVTGAGDFLLGYAAPADIGGSALEGMMATAPNLADWQIFSGALLGMFGLFLEGLCFFGIYRLMADSAPRLAHIFRAGIFGYIWLAPVASHMNLGLYYYMYKYLYSADPTLAHQVFDPMYLAFGVVPYALLVAFWLPAIVTQFLAFARGCTPYPTWAKWFNVLVGGAVVLAISFAIGAESALGGGIGTMFLSVGNAFTFGGLLATMPDERRFQEFEEGVAAR